MRLAFTSDLHVDHHPEVVALIGARARGADVLVVAGDVSPALDRVEETLRRLRAAVARVAFVPGNHDLWCGPGDGDSRARYLEALPAVCDRAGAHYLPEGPLAVDGVVLVGQTGWYDYSLRDPAHDEAIPLDAYRAGRFGPLAWTDRRFVRWPDVDDETLTRWMAARLAADLRATPPGRPIVVVTHMLPFEELVVRRPLPWGFVNGFLGARRLGEVILAAAREGVDVAQVIAGHTHFRRSARVRAGERELVAETSPIGYPREIERAGHDLAAHVRERVQVVEIAG